MHTIESFLGTTIIIAFHMAGVITVSNALLHKRSSQGTIAWVFGLILFPYLGLPLYWILGRNNFKGYTNFREDQRDDIVALENTIIANFERAGVRSVPNVEPVLVAEKLTHLSMLSSNKATLLINGRATFDSIFEGIKKAQNYILIQFYIIEDDSLGRELLQHLVERASAGVEVLFLYDRIGSKLPPSYLKTLRSAGVQVYDFYAKKGLRNPFRVNFRNHRKIVVVDGEVAWIGGHNVSNDYLGKGKLGHWRDTHVKIEGAAVLAAQLSFAEDWYWVTKQIKEFSWIPKVIENGVGVLVVPTGPADKSSGAQLTLLHAINSATDRLWLASPYFIPDEAINTALQVASLRGVDVRVLIPDNPDHFLVYHATFAYFSDVIESGVQFYRYTNGFLHQKVILIDSDLASVGTLNLDNRSLHLNFEITAFIKDAAFAQEIESMLLTDFESSRVMTHRDLKLSTFEIIKSRFSYLFSPIL